MRIEESVPAYEHVHKIQVLFQVLRSN